MYYVLLSSVENIQHIRALELAQAHVPFDIPAFKTTYFHSKCHQY